MDMTSMLFGFLLGILFMVIVLVLTIQIANRRFMNRVIEENYVDNQEIRDLINAKHKKILASKRIGFTNNLDLMQELTKELIVDISKYYYPSSKYPYYEISFIEAIEMNERINERLKKILEIKGLNLLKNIRISQIIYILEVKKNITNNPIYQFSKKVHLDKFVSYGIAALNVANPAYWIRRLIFTSTLETTLRGVSIITLNIVGQEAKRLYSKKIEENSDKILEKELQRFIKEIEASN